jgi:hypothetical protein
MYKEVTTILQDIYNLINKVVFNPKHKINHVTTI